MQTVVRGKHVEVTGAMKQYVERKVDKLDRFFEREFRAQVVLSVEHGEHIVEITIPIDGITLRAEESTHDMYAAVDLAIDKLERQVRKHKTRIHEHSRGSGLAQVLAVDSGHLDDDDDEDEGELGEIVRRKRVPMKPMHVEEAILQMNLLSHDFFVFNNAENSEVNVLYRRRDGNYGLIGPDV